MGAPFTEIRGALLHHMDIAGFSCLIVAAAVAVKTTVESIENGIIHMYKMFTKSETRKLDLQYQFYICSTVLGRSDNFCSVRSFFD